jgi:hypothetical protein
MLQGYGDTVLRAETLEKELNKARKHSAMLQSKLDGAFTQYKTRCRRCKRKAMTWFARISCCARRIKVCRGYLLSTY